MENKEIYVFLDFWTTTPHQLFLSGWAHYFGVLAL